MNRLKNNYKEYLLVLIGWLLLGVIVLLFARGMSEGLSIWEFAKFYCIYFSGFLVILYINSLLLLPKLYYKSKKWAYFTIILVLGILVAFWLKPFEHMIQEVRKRTMPYWEKRWLNEMKNSGRLKDSAMFRFREGTQRGMQPPPPRDGEPMMRNDRHDGPKEGGPPFRHLEDHKQLDFISLIIFFFLIGSGLAVESSRRLAQSEQKRLLAEAEKTKAELSFLKAQVNPHFLFNTLNNIYSMALVQKEETPDAIMRLSNIMRYVTESSDIDFIGLGDEIDFVSDYVYLNELKGGRQLDLDYSVNGDVIGKEIAPLLLISFIENAFKYGISKREKSPIVIRIDVVEGFLKMMVSNKIFQSKDKMTENTGIGIENARKRLETLYAGRYHLNLRVEENVFIVNLDIPLVINKQDED
ncbi:MAG: hypothetical protein DI598_09865 [Pseudopedobacter saltans]|uniref:Signal transduction histidine kinase internal region domain-containing protein n=1 Tax=Pseudopedobacter saltans TaxID=151895 RepID=A0A2W5EWY6_9SPHI|nr:MAG: hypothetical protein DI598_09865 [Pseudopedobacter saltans]